MGDMCRSFPRHQQRWDIDIGIGTAAPQETKWASRATHYGLHIPFCPAVGFGYRDPDLRRRRGGADRLLRDGRCAVKERT